MDIEKLIKRLRTESLYADKASLEIMDLCMEAATALSTLQDENKRLNKIVCSIPTTPDSGRTVSQYDKEMSMCAYLDDLEAENEKLRAELEQVKAGRDAAIEYLREIEWCAGCKHFGGLDGCKKWAMGQCTEKHDLYEFIGPQKED